jgi:hypothetical protein
VLTPCRCGRCPPLMRSIYIRHKAVSRTICKISKESCKRYKLQGKNLKVARVQSTDTVQSAISAVRRDTSRHSPAQPGTARHGSKLGKLGKLGERSAHFPLGKLGELSAQSRSPAFVPLRNSPLTTTAHTHAHSTQWRRATPEGAGQGSEGGREGKGRGSLG